MFPKKAKKYYKKAAAHAPVKFPKPLTKSTSAKYLIIVESPSKCAKIESYLGPQYQCIASRGHLCGIHNLKSIQKDSYEVEFEILESKKAHINQMRDIISNFPPPHIFLACDDDREGEAIAWHIITLFRLPLNVPRIVFHEITEKAILHAVQNPRTLNMSTVWSQRARQVLDILVGFRVSPMLWRFICSDRKDPLSAGRCQSVALRLVYENAMKTSPQEMSGMRRATFYTTSRLIPFTLFSPLSLPSKQDCIDWIAPWRNPIEWRLSCLPAKRRFVAPPLPLTTARLLQQYTHGSPHTVMELCQILYQDGYITYMRTDSAQYSAEFVNQCRAFLSAETGFECLDESRIDSYTSSTTCTSGGGVGGVGGGAAHEAIRVTNLSLRSILEAKDPKLNTLYQFIWRTTLQSCMKPAEYEDRVWVLHPVEAKYTIEIPIYRGWQSIEKTENVVTCKAQEASGLDLFLSTVKNPVVEKITLEECTDRPHRHYSESALIHQLEQRGIGRPSTYATIVHTLSDRGYVRKTDIQGTQQTLLDLTWTRIDDNLSEKERVVWVGKEQGKLLLQPIGQQTCEFLMQHFTDLLSYDYSSRMETSLDNVQSHIDPGEAYKSLCRQCDNDLKGWLKPLQKWNKKELPRIFDSTDRAEYEYKTTPKGGYLRNVATGECKPLRDSIQVDLQRLEQGQLDAADLLEFPGNSDILGELKGETIRFQKSTFGWFLKWGEDKTISIPGPNLHQITLEEVAKWVGEKESVERLPPPPPGCLRNINSVLSIRRGKFGPYVFNAVNKTCTSLRKFRGDFMHCPEEELLVFMAKTGIKT